MTKVYYRVVKPISPIHELRKGSTGELLSIEANGLENEYLTLRFEDGVEFFHSSEVKIVGMLVHTILGDLYLLNSTSNWWYRTEQNPFRNHKEDTNTESLNTGE